LFSLTLAEKVTVMDVPPAKGKVVGLATAVALDSE
jgi:hypothetical protein